MIWILLPVLASSSADLEWSARPLELVIDEITSTHSKAFLFSQRRRNFLRRCSPPSMHFVKPSADPLESSFFVSFEPLAGGFAPRS